MDLSKLTKTQLLHLIKCYDQYIQDFYDCHEDGCPVCISEFMTNEWQEIVENGYEDYINYCGYDL